MYRYLQIWKADRMSGVFLLKAHNLSPAAELATPIQGIAMVSMSMQTATAHPTNMPLETRNILQPSLMGQHILKDSPTRRLLKTAPAAIQIGQGPKMNTLLVLAMA